MPFWSKKNEIPAVQPAGGLPSGPRPGMGAGSPAHSYQSANSYQSSARTGDSGYGSNPAGGYGGMPPPGSGGGSGRFGSQGRAGGGGYAPQQQDPDAARRDLFAGAKPPSERFGRGFDRQDSDGGYGGGAGGGGEGGQEMDEEDEVDAIKQQMRFTKQESLASTRNALRMAREAEETARGTLNKLGEQSERIGNTDRNLDLARAHNVRAEDEAREIQKLNRSIFRPTFTMNKQGKRDAEEARIVDRHMREKAEREDNRRQMEESRGRIGDAYRQMDRGGSGSGSGSGRTKGRDIAGRSRFQFESTASDDEVENELDDNLDEIGDLAGRLNILAKAQGAEVMAQNKKLDGMTGKVDVLDNEVVRNTERLNRIK